MSFLFRKSSEGGTGHLPEAPEVVSGESGEELSSSGNEAESVEPAPETGDGRSTRSRLKIPDGATAAETFAQLEMAASKDDLEGLREQIRQLEAKQMAAAGGGQEMKGLFEALGATLKDALTDKKKTGRLGSTTDAEGKADRATKFARDSLPVVDVGSSIMEIDSWAKAVRREARACSLDNMSERAKTNTVVGLIPNDIVVAMRGNIDFDNLAEVKKNTWEEILQKIVDYFRNTCSTLEHEATMMSRKRRPNESVALFANELARLIGFTTIGAFDKKFQEAFQLILFCFGINDPEMTKQLKLQEKLVLKSAVDLCTRIESARPAVKANKVEAEEPAKPEAEALGISEYKKRGRGGLRGSRGRGRAEGSKRLDRAEWIKKQACHGCGKLGHLQISCTAGKKDDADLSSVFIDEEEAASMSEKNDAPSGDVEDADNNALSGCGPEAGYLSERMPVVAELQYVDINASMQAETGETVPYVLRGSLADGGSQVNVLASCELEAAAKSSSVKIKTRSSTVRVKAAGGSPLAASREVDVDLHVKGRTLRTTFVVSDQVKQNILNRDVCTALGLCGGSSYVDKTSGFADGNLGAGKLYKKKQWHKKKKNAPSGERTNEEFALYVSQVENQLIIVDEPAEKSENMPEVTICYTYVDGEIDLSAEEVAQKRAELLKKYDHVMDDPEKPLSTMRGEPMKIILKPGAGPTRPIRQARPIPFAERDEVYKALMDMVKRGVIRKLTNEVSDFCAPLHYVRKSDGRIRIVCDLTDLNGQILTPKWHIPTPKESIGQIPEGAKAFSVIDLASGYWQIALHPDSQLLTAFITPWGRFCYCRVSMGLRPAGDIFSMKTDIMFMPVAEKTKIVDDLCAWGRNNRENLAVSEEIFKVCDKHNLKVNPKKIQLCQPSVKYAGSIIDAYGVKPDPERLKAIAEFPVPRNRTDLRSFIGLAEQVAQYTDKKATSFGPLRHLSKKESTWIWDATAQHHFEAARKAMTAPTALARYDRKQELQLYTDSSKLHGHGFVLMQVDKDTGKKGVLEAGSRFLTPAEPNYAVVELELSALVWSILKLRVYLQGRQFTVFTDHQPLVGVLNKPLAEHHNARLANLAAKISHYTFTTVWLPGARNQMADALSRSPVDEATAEDAGLVETDTIPMVAAVLVEKEECETQFVTLVREESKEDELCVKLRARLTGQAAWSRADELENQRNVLSIGLDGSTVILEGTKVVLPSSVKPIVLKMAHSEAHSGRSKMLNQIRRVCYWPGLTVAIDAFVRECSVCASRQRSKVKDEEAKSWPPTAAFAEISSDFFSHEGQTYLVIVDRLSNFFEVEKMSSTAGQCTATQFRKFFARWGSPKILKTDGGPQYTSGVFSELMAEFRIKHVTSSPYHPASNGHAESAGVKQAKKLVAINGYGTDAFYKALAASRNMEIESRGESPAMIVLGKELSNGLWPAREERKELPPAACRAAARLKADMTLGLKDNAGPMFHVGQRVLIQDVDPLGDHRWSERGVITKRHSGRSYAVLGDDGFTSRRNVKFLRLERDAAPESEAHGSVISGSGPETGDVPGSLPVATRRPGRPRGSKTRAVPHDFEPRRSARRRK